jgi:hypothetical protein
VRECRRAGSVEDVVDVVSESKAKAKRRVRTCGFNGPSQHVLRCPHATDSVELASSSFFPGLEVRVLLEFSAFFALGRYCCSPLEFKISLHQVA